MLLTYVFYFDDVECLSFIWMERVKSAIKKLIYDTKDAFFFAWVRDSYYIFSRALPIGEGVLLHFLPGLYLLDFQAKLFPRETENDHWCHKIFYFACATPQGKISGSDARRFAYRRDSDLNDFFRV